MNYQTFAADGAWCFFADPRALYYEGQYRRTYAGWLTSQGDVGVGFYDHDSGVIDSVVLRESLQKDDHANPSLWFDSSGRLTVFYSAHNGSAMYYRTSSSPENISDFGKEQQMPGNIEGNKGYTYPNPIYLNKEQKLILFWRGGNFKPVFSTCDHLQDNHWSETRVLIEDSGRRPYIKFASDGEDTIHFACTDGHPNEEAHNGIHYACYRDGALYRADGSLIKPVSELPLQISELDTVLDAETSGKHAWIWDIATDHDGHPVIVYAVFVSKSDHRYYCSRWDGEQWETNEIVDAGSWFPQTPSGSNEREPYYSGGLILDHRNPNIIYLSRSINGSFEIERWQTADLGRTWTTTPVTSSSSGLHVRPFVSRGPANGPAVLFWMHGEYVHYTDYQTSLQMLVLDGA